jgi:DNA-binding transcriptional regulator YiaG
MPNIASVLKEEIVRLARKQLRSETAGLKKASAKYRSEIAALKRSVAALGRQMSRIERRTVESASPPASTGTPTRVRFSAKGLRTQRRRLGMSAADLGAILGASAKTIYSWESETTRPRDRQVAAIAALRRIGKREAAARLAAC